MNLRNRDQIQLLAAAIGVQFGADQVRTGEHVVELNEYRTDNFVKAAEFLGERARVTTVAR